jgi:hypothetical protein
MDTPMLSNTATERTWFMPTPPDCRGLVPTLAALVQHLFREDLAEWRRHDAARTRALAKWLKG